MLEKRKRFVAFLVGGLSSLTAFAVDIATANAPTEITDRQLSIGPRQLRLPSGDWHLASVREGQVTRAGITKVASTQQAYAVRLIDKKWRGSVFFRASEQGTGTRGGWAVEPCKEEATIYKDDFNSGYRLPECLFVKKRTSHLRNPNGAFYEKAQEWFKESNVALPSGSVYEISYQRFATNAYAIVTVILPSSQTIGDEAVIAWARGLPEKLRLMAEAREDVAILPEFPTKE
jgi:hypothetical protein